ncbi:MAG TPA: ABC transporter six-transmembrane domain-containing protein [Bacteroidota bacterium]|nr:ABC transporter six-transmembrane domain-containing protein [Bacteroidota bacterium]
MHLGDLFRRFSKGILIATFLVVVENVAWIAEPTLFGNVIDALIEKAALTVSASFVIPLAAWISVFLLNSGVGALRRAIDPKIFLKMFTEVATDVATAGKERGESVSRTAARAELSREFISFAQYRVPEVIEQSISIGGAVFALFFFDWRIAFACLFIVLPLLVISRLYNSRVIAIQKDLHDTREDAYDVFSTKDPSKVRSYYTTQTRAEQKIANWGALNFGAMRLFLLGIFLVVLYIAIDLDDFSTGSIYSIVAYLWTFVTSSEYLPELMESWTSLKDISRRLASEKL